LFDVVERVRVQQGIYTADSGFERPEGHGTAQSPSLDESLMQGQVLGVKSDLYYYLV